MQTTIRDAQPGDRAEIVALVPRLRAFGAPPLRPAEDLDRAEVAALSRALDELPEHAALFVAENAEDASIVGVAFMETATDYFTGEKHAHLAILSVAAAAEGHGVGRALLNAVEEWASARKYRFITLNVFAGNEHARKVYERAGYRIDTIKYLKELG